MLDSIKSKLRYSILEKLKKKGTPAPSPVPGSISESEMLGDEEETLNDLDVVPDLKDRLRPKKKLPLEDEESY